MREPHSHRGRLATESRRHCHILIKWIHREVKDPIPPAVDHMTFFNRVLQGAGIGFSVVFVIAIADGLSSYVFAGETISQKVKGRIGASPGNGGA